MALMPLKRVVGLVLCVQLMSLEGGGVRAAPPHAQPRLAPCLPQPVVVVFPRVLEWLVSSSHPGTLGRAGRERRLRASASSSRALSSVGWRVPCSLPSLARTLTHGLPVGERTKERRLPVGERPQCLPRPEQEQGCENPQQPRT